jgi:hypothetical protein
MTSEPVLSTGYGGFIWPNGLSGNRLTCPPLVRQVMVIVSPGLIVEGSIVKSVIVIGCGVAVIFGAGEIIGRGDGLRVADGFIVGCSAVAVAVGVDDDRVVAVASGGSVAVLETIAGDGVEVTIGAAQLDSTMARPR